MMHRALILAGVLGLVAPAVAADTPIGALKANGEATVTATGSTIRLKDENYAYFSGDEVRTAEGASVVIILEGMDVVFAESSIARVSMENDTFLVDVIQGRVTVDAVEGVPYAVLHNGEPLTDADGTPSGQPVLVDADRAEARLYIPAQLTQDQIDALEASGSFNTEEIEALKNATKNMSQDELASMTEDELRALLPPPGSKGGLSTAGKVGIAAGIIALTAVVIDANDDGGVAAAPSSPTPAPPPPSSPPLPNRPPPGTSGADDVGSGS